ncbi:hypothetical protein, variant 1 [Cladophialophora immunda]|uniref:DNA/RNA-binding domain-containing protein n=1 Tax=Cladophialophora immunda TaxID=569365 RepID=A0A0D2CUS7_9EURO|nr:uncharacterized protein PV07_07140 [Cladophialophora immunda]XP_016247616.1 hypothetical protein, variant 1 [Cladophialophora immunda]KIW27399.1 hypothetical protein PV07_07140 [Cladophialophora immunda]KIW27400.1 hypothetical protein, variant 1 [Cladophialophora immunda]
MAYPNPGDKRLPHLRSTPPRGGGSAHTAIAADLLVRKQPPPLPRYHSLSPSCWPPTRILNLSWRRTGSYQNHTSPTIKQEPSKSLNNLSLEDSARPFRRANEIRSSNRPAAESEWRPSKIGPGSASPAYSPGRHEHEFSRIHFPPPDSSRRSPSAGGYQPSQQTPVPHQSRQNSRTLAQHAESERRCYDARPASAHSSQDDFSAEADIKPLLQPETRPISQEQLVNEVKGIYAGLVMVEKKCVEICAQQAQTTTKLSNEQWQALIALHRTLLHEHHDFFLASQHPTASPALWRLPTKYAMPARMWRHGIHSFLELLRHRLPYSLEHMLSFVYLAYQMMGLLMESVPAFHETWIECLGDLARYRMAIEEADLRDRETWSNVARMWYQKAADRSPDTGRIQHHLAVLARPNIVCQLFHYSKALISVNPFPNARDSIMLLFNPLLDACSGQKSRLDSTHSKYSKLESSLVTAAGLLFTKGSIDQYCFQVGQFTSELENHIARSGVNWKVQGPEVASALIAFLLDYGSEENFLWKSFRADRDGLRGSQIDPQQQQQQQQQECSSTITPDPMAKQRIHSEFWEQNGPINASDFRQAPPPPEHRVNVNFTSADEVTSYALPVWSKAISIVAAKLGDRNILPFLHLTLAFLWSLSYVPGALIYVENYVPWSVLVLSLNSLSRSGVVDAHVESKEFPQQQSGTGRQLPEDFPIRGLVWAPYYFPSDFFEGDVVDEDERALELPSHTAPRAERCLWLGVRLASLNRYITYDRSTKQFGCTSFALSLSENASMHTLRVQTPITAELDLQMTDV